jgi:hypothetical protein
MYLAKSLLTIAGDTISKQTAAFLPQSCAHSTALVRDSCWLVTLVQQAVYLKSKLIDWEQCVSFRNSYDAAIAHNRY